MATAGLVIRVAFKVGSSPIKALTGAWDKMFTPVRRMLRVFRDLTIVGYGLRRGFDLLSRTIQKTFVLAGGRGVYQLDLLSKATRIFGAGIAGAIQKSATFQMAIGKLTKSFAGGLTEADQKAWAKGFDNVAALVLTSVADGIEALGRLFMAAQSGFDSLIAKLQHRPVQLGALSREVEAEYGGKIGVDQAHARMSASKDWENFLPDSVGGPLRPASRPASRPATLPTPTVANPFQSSVDALRQKAGEIRSKAGKGDEDLPQYFDEMVIAVNSATQAVEGLGEAWTGVLGDMSMDLLDTNVSIQESFKNLGTNAGKVFTKQATAGLVDPMAKVFNEVASLATMPFRIVGEVITNLVLRPITDVLTTFIPKFVGEMISGQAAVTTATLANQQVVGTGAAAEAGKISAAMAPAAAGAGIATFGTALVFGGLAIGIMALAATQFLEDGGIVMPRPGGTPAIIGEGGQPEVVLPLDRAHEVLGGAIGGRPITVIVKSGDLRNPSERRRAGRGIAKAIEDERASNSYSGRSSRR